jgi:hypothetical protein
MPMTKPHKSFDWDSLGLDFGNWEEEKIWALDLSVIEMDIKDLLWHFDAPFWTNDHNERWTITPWDVIRKSEDSKNEQTAMEKSDLSFPIDILKNNGRWLILDGLHRLTKSYIQGKEKVNVRIIPRERLPEILTGDPIELPER